MQLQLRPSRPEDVPRMVEVYFDAFSNDIVHQRFAPKSSELAHEFWAGAFSAEIPDKHNHFLSVWGTSADNAAGPETLIGFAKWIAPGAPAEPLPRLEDWPQDGDPAFAASFFAKLQEWHVEALGGRPHWHLEMLAVGRRFQGMGAAGLMLRYGVERADAQGLECFLDASPVGLPIYERFGFRVVCEERFLDGRYAQCAMVRDVKKGQVN